MKRSKRYTDLAAKRDRDKKYSLSDTVGLIKEMANTKFNESVDVAIRLGVDPKKADQMVRGTVSLPHGTGQTVRVLVLCNPPKDKEALEAGADMAGLNDYIEKIESGWDDIDAIVATPDVMKDVGKLGRFLGRKGLMPNPKAGTVTFDVGKAVKELKAGRIEFRVDKYGNIHTSIGKSSFSKEQLAENFQALYDTIVRLKPAAVKGQYVRNLSLSTTMGPGISIDQASIVEK
jgi:large subunit ribosomal protein L1